MLFKQLQLFKLEGNFQPEMILAQLEALPFKPCLPSMPASAGWVSPIDEEGEPIARTINGCTMICLQIEEKILPASVVGLALKDKVKKLETAEDRKVRKKEKLSLKEDITQTLLQRAFVKLTRLYAYIDNRNKWLMLSSVSPSRTEFFVSAFKKSFGDVLSTIEVTKPSSILTQWLKDQDYPNVFSVEKSCVLQDPGQQNRVIRCQQQDLFAGSIQALLKDGCEVIQLGLCWHDRLNFVLADDFTLRSIRLAEDDLADMKEDTEGARQQFDAELFMMTEMYTGLMNDLLGVFVGDKEVKPKQKLALVG
jgi:recombination associated protein RdgC